MPQMREDPELPPVSDGQAFLSLLHHDMNAFIEFTFGVVRPGALYRPNWHLDAIAHKLARVVTGETRRLIITLPPRNLKSLSASVALPAYYLGRNPSERVLTISYSETLARAHANDFRQVVSHPVYQAVFPAMRVERDTDREITTSRRGRRFASSIEGTLAGLGGSLIVIDDPIKPGEADSEAVRTRVLDWYRNTLITRADDKKNARIVLVMQRVHQQDLAGYLVEQGGFEHLDLPAVAPEDSVHDIGYGRHYERRAGELLHPEHEPASVLAEIRREMGPVGFSAQYQQSPIPPGGRVIRRAWLREYVGNLGVNDSDDILVSWDIALSEAATGDYSAGVVLLKRGDDYYVLDVVRGRWRFDLLVRKILETRRRFPGSTLLIEESPISKGLIQSLREQHVSVVEAKPHQDKRARLIAQSDLFAAGSVKLPKRAPWRPDFEAELLAFPGGRHDDQVDALAQALAWKRVKRGGIFVSTARGLW